jgi:predicted hydrocarbon binding protein
MSEDLGRQIASARARRFLLAIQDVMGLSGLATVLRQANLQRYVAWPGDNNLRAAEYAALMQAIENYYGRGARGTLMRIGYAEFKRLLAGHRTRAMVYGMLTRVMPVLQRQLLALNWLAKEWEPSANRALVQKDGATLALLDYESDATFGRRREAEICWTTLGQIQEALKWATGQEFDVLETQCKARGALACRFEVGRPIGG